MHGEADSGKNCIVLPVMERGPTGRVTREERVYFRSPGRTGPPDGGRPLRPPGCTGLILSRPFVCRRNGIAKHRHKTASLAVRYLLRLRPTFGCSLFALANPVSDIVPSRTPLRSIHPRAPGASLSGTWVHHHPAAACAAASALRARALRAALRATFC